MEKILLIEDSVQMQKYITDFLTQQSYEVKVLEDYDNVVKEVEDFKPNLVLLDINLPKYDGFFYLKLIRKNFNTPVIILSARSDESEQIRGIENGATDYITKPFSINILLAKINGLFQRQKEELEQKSNADDKGESDLLGIKINHKLLNFTYNNSVVDLTKNEYKILSILINNVNEVVSRNELLELLWDDSSFVDDNTLTVNVSRLKKKLTDVGLDDVIVSKRGVGYVFSSGLNI